MRVDRFLAVFLRVSAVAGAAGVSDVRFPFLEARAWELSSPFKSRLLARARARARVQRQPTGGRYDPRISTSRCFLSFSLIVSTRRIRNYEIAHEQSRARRSFAGHCPRFTARDRRTFVTSNSRFALFAAS